MPPTQAHSPAAEMYTQIFPTGASRNMISRKMRSSTPNSCRVFFVPHLVSRKPNSQEPTREMKAAIWNTLVINALS